jgi:hypothetical protein
MGVDRLPKAKRASRGAVGLVKSGKKTNANDKFSVTDDMIAPGILAQLEVETGDLALAA